MTDKQFVVFKNRCAFCGYEGGTLFYRWAAGADDIDGQRVYAYQRGHTVSFFECLKCGAVTRFENIPMITGVNAP